MILPQECPETIRRRREHRNPIIARSLVARLRGDRAPTPRDAPKAAPPKTPAQAEIEYALRMYEAAFLLKDVDVLRRVQALSSAEAKALKTEFANALQYRVTVEKADIRP